MSLRCRLGFHDYRFTHTHMQSNLTIVEFEWWFSCSRCGKPWDWSNARDATPEEIAHAKEVVK